MDCVYLLLEFVVQWGLVPSDWLFGDTQFPVPRSCEKACLERYRSLESSTLLKMNSSNGKNPVTVNWEDPHGGVKS